MDEFIEDTPLKQEDYELPYLMESYDQRFTQYEYIIADLLGQNDDLYDKYIHLWAKYMMTTRENQKLRQRVGADRKSMSPTKKKTW